MKAKFSHIAGPNGQLAEFSLRCAAVNFGAAHSLDLRSHVVDHAGDVEGHAGEQHGDRQQCNEKYGRRRHADEPVQIEADEALLIEQFTAAGASKRQNNNISVHSERESSRPPEHSLDGEYLDPKLGRRKMEQQECDRHQCGRDMQHRVLRLGELGQGAADERVLLLLALVNGRRLGRCAAAWWRRVGMDTYIWNVGQILRHFRTEAANFVAAIEVL